MTVAGTSLARSLLEEQFDSQASKPRRSVGEHRLAVVTCRREVHGEELPASRDAAIMIQVCGCSIAGRFEGNRPGVGRVGIFRHQLDCLVAGLGGAGIPAHGDDVATVEQVPHIEVDPAPSAAELDRPANE